MQSVANWITRVKWLLIFALIIWGLSFLPGAYAECRAAGHNNIGCGVLAVLSAYFSVIVYSLAAVTMFLSWVLP
jgi:hypothetical protein